MGIHTPPSLNWLINKRAHTLGLLEAHDKQVALVRAEQDKHRGQLVADLAAIDRVITLHEVSIPPEIIPAIRPITSRHRLQPGKLTRFILNALAAADGKPLTTHEVALYVAGCYDTPQTQESWLPFRNSVRKRLKELCGAGRVIRMHEPRTKEMGRWCLCGRGDQIDPTDTPRN